MLPEFVGNVVLTFVEYKLILIDHVLKADERGVVLHSVIYEERKTVLFCLRECVVQIVGKLVGACCRVGKSHTFSPDFAAFSAAEMTALTFSRSFLNSALLRSPRRSWL